MEDILKMLHARRGELIAEMERVDAAIEALEGKLVTPNDARATLGTPKLVNYRRMSTKLTPRRTNRRMGGKREDHVLKLLKQGPLTVPDITRALGTGSTYMYRVLPRMEREGKIKKVGKKYELV